MINFFKKLYYEKYSKKSYSISNVDLVIDRMFSEIKKGYFIDIGCNHPIKFNNCYALYKRGWRGINIDLDKDCINEFNKLRNKDYNFHAVVSSKSDIEKEVYIYHSRSAINTVSAELIKYRNTDIDKIKIVKQKTETLENIIDKSPFRDKKFNLLSIDIENHEHEVLKDFNFNKYIIDVIVIEIHNLKQRNLEIWEQSIEFVLNSKIYKLLINNNYKLINWVNSDFIFIRKGTKLK